MASGGPYARAIEAICANRDWASKASRAIAREKTGWKSVAELTRRFHELNVALRPN
jgi:hypothetical protein